MFYMLSIFCAHFIFVRTDRRQTLIAEAILAQGSSGLASRPCLPSLRAPMDDELVFVDYGEDNYLAFASPLCELSVYDYRAFMVQYLGEYVSEDEAARDLERERHRAGRKTFVEHFVPHLIDDTDDEPECSEEESENEGDYIFIEFVEKVVGPDEKVEEKEVLEECKDETENEKDESRAKY